MKSIKAAFLTAAATVLFVGSAIAGPIANPIVTLDPTGVGALPTGFNAQQICPVAPTLCPGNNFVSPVGNSFALVILNDALFSASITDIQSPSTLGTVNSLTFALYDSLNNLMGSGSHVADLDDLFLMAGAYTMYVAYDFTGGANAPANSSASWAMTMATSSVTIPEPGTLVLVGLALAGMGFSLRRKQS